MPLRRPHFAACSAAALGGWILTAAAAENISWAPPAWRRQTSVHDPSSILEHNGRYYLFSTGFGLSCRWSSDLVQWTNGPSVFNDPPSWAKAAVPGLRRSMWAPDVIHLNGRYYLYYSVSTFGKQLSAIGLATNLTLDPAGPGFRWVDQGPVIQSTNGSPFNAIDPGVTRDTDGRLWMVFGSYWKGIHLVELDARTGLRFDAQSPVHRLAWSEAIEAPCLTRHGDWYYLFVNWGTCCRGTNSTYEIRVGRSKAITGPYVDRDGRDLVNAGGSLFLGSTGRFIGPGHLGILHDRGKTLFSYHYYDAESGGLSRLAIGEVAWSPDEEGWPRAKNWRNQSDTSGRAGGFPR